MKFDDWDAYFSSLIGDDLLQVPGLALLVYHEGREVYRFTGGFRRFQPKSLPMTADSRFRIASVSKMFTIFTLLQLAERGRLSLDDDVSRYLGFRLRHPAHDDIPLTLRMLASHTSGLRDGRVYSIPPAVSVEAFFKPGSPYWENGQHFAPPEEVPRQYFTYCNLNYGLLGTVIEAVTGQRFDDYQKAHLLKDLDCLADYVPGNLLADEFEKLGTIYGKDEEQGRWIGRMDDFKGHQPERDTIALQNPYDEAVCQIYELAGYQPGTNATLFSPQGGLRLSLDEMGQTLEMILHDGVYRGRRILQASSLREMFSPQWTYDGHNGDTCGQTIFTYGLGEFGVDGDGPARPCREKEISLWGHTGQAFGLLSGLFVIPGTRSGFAYVMNGEGMAEEDPGSCGSFSTNYIWEERVLDGLCRFIDGL